MCYNHTYDFEEIKLFISSIGLKQKESFLEEFTDFIDDNNIQRNLPKNMIYQFITLFFIYKKATSEKKVHIIDIIDSYETFNPLYSTKKIHEKIEELYFMLSFDYSQVYWYCKNNFEWIFDMEIFDPDKNEYQNFKEQLNRQENYNTKNLYTNLKDKINNSKMFENLKKYY